MEDGEMLNENETREMLRPTMIYWTSSDGTILRGVSYHADLVGRNDDIFAAPFRLNSIVGSNLFQFIGCAAVIHLYRALAERVLRTGKSVAFTYRCDGPGTRREMSMNISRNGREVRYDSVLISETSRVPEIRSTTPNATMIVALCSFCKKYRFPLGSTIWKELESLYTEADLSAEFEFTHSICAPCFTRAMNS